MIINLNKVEITTFPDGLKVPNIIKYNRDDKYLIKASIKSFDDLFILGQVVDILRNYDSNCIINLELHYLIGSRMDRPIDYSTPNTLKVVCDYINSLKFNKIVTVWAHSQSTDDRLNADSDIYQESQFIINGLYNFQCMNKKFGLILPDSGSAKRYWNNHHNYVNNGDFDFDVIECSKHRDMKTGKLSGFHVPCNVPDECVIVDDLCDGGGTFVGLSDILRKNGAKKVSLIVYHGIFSKGLDVVLSNIDQIYTSNSFNNFKNSENVFIKDVL